MQALIVQIVLGLLRVSLGGVAVWLANHNVISNDQFIELLSAVAVGVVALGWQWIVTHRHYFRFLTAAAMKPSSPEQVEAQTKFNPAVLPASKKAIPRIPMVLLAAMLGAGAFGVSNCAKVQTLPQAPQIVTLTDTQLRAATKKAYDVLQAVGQLNDRASQIEASLYADKTVPEATHQKLVAGFRTVATNGIKAVDQIEKGVTSWAQIKAVLDPIVAALQPILDLVQHGGSTLKQKLLAFVQVALDLIGNELGEYMFGGGRLAVEVS